MLLFLIACSNPTQINKLEPYIIGTITEVTAAQEYSEIFVEENVSIYGPKKKEGKKVILSIFEVNEIYKQTKSKTKKRINSTYLKTGLEVKVWIKVRLNYHILFRHV